MHHTSWWYAFKQPQQNFVGLIGVAGFESYRYCVASLKPSIFACSNGFFHACEEIVLLRHNLYRTFVFKLRYGTR